MSALSILRARAAQAPIGATISAEVLLRAPTNRDRAALSYLAKRGYLVHLGAGQYRVERPILAVRERRRTCPHCGGVL